MTSVLLISVSRIFPTIFRSSIKTFGKIFILICDFYSFLPQHGQIAAAFNPQSTFHLFRAPGLSQKVSYALVKVNHVMSYVMQHAETNNRWENKFVKVAQASQERERVGGEGSFDMQRVPFTRLWISHIEQKQQLKLIFC